MDKAEVVDLSLSEPTPLTKFVLEENFKRRLSDSRKGVLPILTVFVTPQLEVTKVFVRNSPTGEPLCDVAMVLRTRNDDKLILSPLHEEATDEELRKNDDKEEFRRKGQRLVAYFGKIFKEIKAVGNTSKILYPLYRNPLNIKAVMDYKHLNIYHNPKTKITYLYDSERKIAFSFYGAGLVRADLISAYGLTDYIKTVKEQRISVDDLRRHYKVLGL